MVDGAVEMETEEMEKKRERKKKKWGNSKRIYNKLARWTGRRGR